ncbi:MAG: hypothetical protein ACLP1D_19080, partial [Xanthobacteraceae bacterium]
EQAEPTPAVNADQVGDAVAVETACIKRCLNGASQARDQHNRERQPEHAWITPSVRVFGFVARVAGGNPAVTCQ